MKVAVKIVIVIRDKNHFEANGFVKHSHKQTHSHTFRLSMPQFGFCLLQSAVACDPLLMTLKCLTFWFSSLRHRSFNQNQLHTIAFFDTNKFSISFKSAAHNDVCVTRFESFRCRSLCVSLWRERISYLQYRFVCKRHNCQCLCCVAR